MIFRLYDAAAGGVYLWEEQWTGSNGVQVSDGLFNVMLGSITPIPQDVITTHDSLFLGITVGTDDEMTPRVQLGSVPFAVQALTVPDGSVSTAKLADGAVTSAKIQDGDVASGDVGFNYAGSATKGGAANDVACSNCIAGGEIQDGQVSSNDVGFKYAGSSSKGGAASDVACSNCIASGEIQDGQVKTADLENNAVTSTKIQDGTITQTDAPSLVKASNGNARKIQYGRGTISDVRCAGIDKYCADINLPEPFQDTHYSVAATPENRHGLRVINKTTTGFRVITDNDFPGYFEFDWIAVGR